MSVLVLHEFKLWWSYEYGVDDGHRNNIVAMLTYHTTGRLLIQAAGGEMNGEDAAMFSELTAVGKKCTEYEPTGLTATPGSMTVDSGRVSSYRL